MIIVHVSDFHVFRKEKKRKEKKRKEKKRKEKKRKEKKSNIWKTGKGVTYNSQDLRDLRAIHDDIKRDDFSNAKDLK